MKRSNDEGYFEETKRKEIKLTTTTTSQVIITLDETIRSNLLYRKFKYQTSEFQLFLQHVPVLYWYPLDIVGTTFDTIDACVFSAAIRNSFQDYSVVESMLDCLTCNDDGGDDDDYEFMENEISEQTLENLKRLLKGLLDDELFILQALEEYKQQGYGYSNPLEYASDQLKDNEQFMLKAIKISSDSIGYASDRLRNDDQFISQTATHYDSPPEENEEDCQSYYSIGDSEQEPSKLYATDEYITSKYEILESIKCNYTKLEHVSDRLKDDAQFILKAAQYVIDAFKYASDRLKDNEAFIREAVNHNVNVLKYASDRLKDTEHIILEAIKNSGRAITFASNRLKNDEEFNLKLVQTNGNAFLYVPDIFKDNERIVLEAVKQNAYVPNRFKDNEQILLEAVKNDPIVCKHASDRLKDDESFILQAVKTKGSSLEFASDRLKDNETIVLEAVKKDHNALRHSSDRLRKNEEFVLQLVVKYNDAFIHASDELKDNENIVLEAVKHNVYNFPDASERLRNDFNFAKEIFKNCNDLNLFAGFGKELRNIEFIYYYIENYQSNFHELVRNNTKKTKLNTISSLQVLATTFMD